MSKIQNGGLDQYGSERFKQQQFGTVVAEGLMRTIGVCMFVCVCSETWCGTVVDSDLALSSDDDDDNNDNNDEQCHLTLNTDKVLADNLLDSVCVCLCLCVLLSVGGLSVCLSAALHCTDINTPSPGCVCGGVTGCCWHTWVVPRRTHYND